jgi:hypothetical protein
MITVGYTDGSVVEYSGQGGRACSTRGEVFWYPGEGRMIVPPRSPTPPPDMPQEPER